MKINIVVTDVVNDVKSVDTHVVITLLLHLPFRNVSAENFVRISVYCMGKFS